MGSSSDPPPPPDIKEESQKSVEADLGTLALRRAAELGASKGLGYYAGGKYYKDKAGLDAELAASKKALAEARAAAGERTGPGGKVIARDPDMQAKATELEAKVKELENPQDFSGLADSEFAKNALGILLDSNDSIARRQLALRKELGVENVKQSVEELKAADPESWALRQRLLGEVDDDRTSPELQKLLDDAKSEYELGSRLDDSTAREVEQAVRSAQAARGNVLGSAAATQEAMARGEMGYQRKQQRAQNLAALDNVVAGRKQQRLSDISAVLNNAVVGQFGALGGAQNGAVGFNPVQSKAGTNIAGNAVQMGLGFAQNNYSGQIETWKADQGNPWTNILSGAAGMALGSFTGGIGTGLAAKALGK